MKPKFKLNAWHRLSLSLKTHSAVYSPLNPDQRRRTLELACYWMFRYNGGYARCAWTRHALLGWLTSWRCGTTGATPFACSRPLTPREKRLHEIASHAGLGVKATRRFMHKMSGWIDCPLTPAFAERVKAEVAGLDWRTSFDFLRRMSGRALP